MTCDTRAPQGGIAFEDLGRTRNAALLIEGCCIVALGSERDVVPKVPKDAIELDLRDCAIFPGFVDAHSHPLFAGDREPDFAARTRGEKPEQGMLHTVMRTREALRDPAAFYEETVRPRLRAMLAHGTTTLETKTGYALTKEGELALLDLIREHREEADVPRLAATFLGAHALPPEFASTSAYIDYLIEECLPEVKLHGAEFVDGFCEPGFFSPDECRRYLEAAKSHGLLARLHCDEMSDGGAALMAAEMGAVAFDHCNYINEHAADAIVKSGGVLVACPATIEFLGLSKQAPVREVLQRGGSVALASDFNPGTSPCFNLQTVAYHARKLFRLSASEALYGVTRGAARSLRRDVGHLREGSAADFAALQLDDLREFGWYFGGNLAKLVCKGGHLVGPPSLDFGRCAPYARDDRAND